MGQGRRRGRVGNAHFAGDQQIGLGIYGIPAGGQGLQQLILGHGGVFGEIRRGPIQIKRMHIHPRAKAFGQLVDRRAAMFKIGDHLHRHFRRKRRYTTRRNPMISCKNNDLGRGECGPRIAAPSRIPLRQIL